MRLPWLAILLAGSIISSLSDSIRAQQEGPGLARVDSDAIEQVGAEQPTELPPFITPPKSNDTPRRNPQRDLRPGKGPADYEPAYNYLPERNPGARQPPCPCLPLGRLWIVPSYFLGTTVNDVAPPLVTGARPGGRASVLYGGDRIDHGFRSGMRLDAGMWLDRCQNWGVEGHFFFMESSLSDFRAASSNAQSLARPIIQPDGTRSADVLGVPGGIAITSPLQFLGAEANTRSTLFCEDNRRWDFIAGYRFVRLSESLRIAAVSADANFVEDQFHTENQFHGGQIGFAGEYRFARWYVNGTAKVAFGLNWERLDIAGMTRTGNTVRPAGLLALPSNSGQTREAEFAVVPEANFNLGYQLGDYWRAFVGYTFLYVSSVARPGQAVDSTVNLAQLTPGAFAGELRPLRREAATEFWMQGISFGVEIRY